MDIAFRRGFTQEQYDSLFETVSKAYNMEFKNLSMDNNPAVPVVEAGVHLTAATARTVAKAQKSGAVANSSSSSKIVYVKKFSCRAKF